MSTNYSVTAIDEIGRINCRMETDGKVARKVLVPGVFTDATTFVMTDLGQEDDLIKNTALAVWTPAMVAKYKAAVPFQPQADDPDKPRKDQIKQAPELIDLLDKAKNATDGQINTWLTNNVTTLAQARTVLGAIIKYIAVRG